MTNSGSNTTTNLFGVTLHRFSIQERNCMTTARKPIYIAYYKPRRSVSPG